jgi:hypothetical protein
VEIVAQAVVVAAAADMDMILVASHGLTSLYGLTTGRSFTAGGWPPVGGFRRGYSENERRVSVSVCSNGT